MTSIETKIGDVFLIPLNGKGWAAAQVVSAWNEELYVAVFDGTKEDNHINVEEVSLENPVFLVLTLDAKLWNGDWPIVGNVQSHLHRFPQPAFKVRQNGVVHIESRDRSRSRPASTSEAELLRYRTVSSPAVIEAVVQAYFGVGEWQEGYEKYRADYAEMSGAIL
jgi:hypothetical protein